MIHRIQRDFFEVLNEKLRWEINLINRVYLKDCLSFEEVDLEFKRV